jgi:hypothetical protein
MTNAFAPYDPFAPPIFVAPKPAANPMLAGRAPAASLNTPLSPLNEMAYRQWVQDNKVPTDPNATAPQDYDMRGFYQGLQQGNPKAQSAIDPNDSRLHYPDFWKTPLHQTFSNESQWAPATAPQWTENDQLAKPNGQVVFDDKAPSGGLLSILGLK